MKQEKNVEIFSEKKNNLYDGQRIIKSTNISQAWIKEIIQIVVFHLMLASIQNFVFKISEILFEIAGPIQDRSFCPALVFRK